MANEDRIAKLREKYGAKAIDNVMRIHPDDLTELVEWADEIDPHYARLLLDFTYGGMLARGVLDDRTRSLVLIGQLVALDEMEELDRHVRRALAEGTSPREALEVILQTTVYLGYPRARRAIRVFTSAINALGRMDEIRATQLPPDGRSSERDLESERGQWQPARNPELQEKLLSKYGWRSLSPGLRLQPTHHLESVARVDRVDPHFTKLWLDYIYAGMYSRGVLDDRTRILCIVGELFVLGEFHQAENHIRNALAHGATGREVLEVILQSTIYAGMPRFVRFVGILERALEEHGQSSELTENQPPLPDV